MLSGDAYICGQQNIFHDFIPLIILCNWEKPRVLYSNFWQEIARVIGVLKWSTYFFSFGATAPIWALAYLHETLRFTSVY
jgi:hypothetical protein